ncbi:MAG: response regulator [Ignavibacteriae bacterium]|nr:response regulator [Ignavibacteriota bacterium]
MKNLNYIVLDDEEHVHHVLADHFKLYTDLICKGDFYDARSAQIYTIANKIDFALVDIELGNINGLSFIENLNKEVLIIIISGNVSYAKKGFDLDVVDFLEKPITPERLYQALQKIYNIKYKDNRLNDLENMLKISTINERADFIIVDIEKNDSQKFYYENIVYIQRNTNNTKVVNTEAVVGYTHYSIERHEKLLPKDTFVKVNRGTIINKYYLVDQKNQHVIMKNGSMFKIEEACIAALSKAINKKIE